MQNTENLQEMRLHILKRLFRPYIEGEATLDQVLLEQAEGLNRVDKRLDRVEVFFTLALETLRSGKESRIRGD